MSTKMGKHSPGTVRDAIVHFLSNHSEGARLADIREAVGQSIGEVPPSSIRSYLRLNPEIFERIERGTYRLVSPPVPAMKIERRKAKRKPGRSFRFDNAELIHADCFDWLNSQAENSIHAVVTDPPYGLVEYTEKEQLKLREGKGGVWRIPPSFDGHRRSPLPRFTTLSESDLRNMEVYFQELGTLLCRVLVPGAHAFFASNPLVASLVTTSLVKSGLESRGYVTRLTMTMRGGDRPKNAHREFADVSVMPRSMFEPWILVRKPVEGRVQDNLRRWKTGGLRRVSDEKPFGDVIKSSPTRKHEKEIAPHPSLKPQCFLRQIVRAALPLGEGIVLDPFAGSGSTLAASNAVGYQSIGIELSKEFVQIARTAIPALATITCSNTPSSL